jgi:hypothetical protein
MEVVGAIASVGQIIDLTFKVAQYLKDVQTASAGRRKLAIEVAGLLSLLYRLQDRMEEADVTEPWFQSLRSLTIQDGALDQFKATMEKLANKLQPAGTMKRIGRVLVWTLDKKETDDMLSKIDRLKKDVMISLQIDQL